MGAMGIWNRPILVQVLTPPAILFRCGVAIRNLLFDLGLFRSGKIPARVISVGNITVGGTGKTPLVESLVRILLETEIGPAVVIRGFGRTGKAMVVVSGKEGILASVRQSGDEPFFLARALPGVPVVVDRNRFRAGCHAVEKYRSQVIVLDDGFQHRSVWRDMDVVVFDAGQDPGNVRMLPAGPFREPLSSLKRARWIVLTGMDRCPDPEALMNRIRSCTKAGICTARHRAEEWVGLSDGSRNPPNAFASMPVLGFSGIGNTDSFIRTLEELGIRPVDFIRYRDHHWYSKEDLDRISREAGNGKVKVLVTTEKDAVRLPQDGTFPVPVHFLRISLDIVTGAEEFRRDVKALARM
jgi:tetraacyldisaccharide 4'-kinase